MKNIVKVLFLLFPALILQGQTVKLINGPMLGYSTLHEVMVWVQTSGEAEVQVAYYDSETKQKKVSAPVTALRENAFTAHLVLDSLTEGKQYNYEILLNGEKQSLDYPASFTAKTIWKYKTDPPPFRFVTGSGAYINETKYDRPGSSYGGKYKIFETIYQEKPDFMIWGGDNIYLRQNEWNSWTGVVHRYTHDRALAELQPLWANVHHYAITDDHDFGPNDSDGSFPFKDMTTRAFKAFWANPPYVSGLPSATSYFEWYDAAFFLLDNRYFRSPNHLESDHKTILGAQQLKWLKEALAASKAKFKFVVMGGQFLNSVPKFETYTNYGFAEERQDIIDFIHEQNIKNVIFLTGDRHYTEISILKKRHKPDIIDLTFSPFTSGPNTHALNDPNIYRVEGTVVMKRNFGLIEISGPRKSRVMTVKSVDTGGNVLWERSFKAQ